MGVDEYEGGPRAAVLTCTGGLRALMKAALRIAFALLESHWCATGAVLEKHGHCIIGEIGAGVEVPCRGSLHCHRYL